MSEHKERTTVERLLALTQQLRRTIPLDQAMQAVSDIALYLLPGDHASLRVLDDSGTRLLCGARSGVGLDQKPLSFSPGEGAIGWTVAHKSAARVDDAASDARFKRPSEQVQGFAIGSLLAVPLWAGERVVGVLGCSAPESGAFSDRDEALALLLSDCASPYLERARLERLSITDPVTMAFNRRYLAPRLKEEFERARRNETLLSLLVMALDGHAGTIERHGVLVADRVLQCFTDRVRSSVRLSDILVRCDREEFILIMPDMTLHGAQIVAERIRHSMGEYPLELAAGLCLTQTSSCAVASWSRQESAESLEQRVRVGLAEALQQGGDRTIRSRHFVGRQLDASLAGRCLRDGCEGRLDEVQPEGGRTYHRCCARGCNSIWFFGE
jgi:diguanylate cyclase (GGDEF)-like protein